MKHIIEVGNSVFQYNTKNYFDISIPLRNGEDNPNCFYLPPPLFSPFKAGNFVGSTLEGGNCNCYTITVSPHGNGTHTECIGHILSGYTINGCLKEFFSLAQVVSVVPELVEGDMIITERALENIHLDQQVTSLVIRTLPNDINKELRNYSGANPVYFSPEFMKEIVKRGIKHLITDLPSVDREEDGGKLLAHKAFWNVPDSPRTDCTITELAYISNEIKDDMYLLTLQIAPLESDASPSKPLLFPLNSL